MAGALALGPWVGAVRPASTVERTVRPRLAIGEGAFGRPGIEGRGGGCGCDSIVINAINKVRDAKIRSGDAEVRNVNLTYITASYMASIDGDIDVEVKQRAKAVSGNAIAGQVIGALPTGSRCKNVLIRALNIVEDVKVRSGDATAVNRNIVLLDPGIDRGRVHVNADQVAEADAGDAIAGQVIGVGGGGRDARGCGSLRVEADNRVRDAKIKTGDAEFENYNKVRSCYAMGCARELLRYLDDVSALRVCSARGCRLVGAAELRASLLAAQIPSPSPLPPVPEPVADTDPSPSPGPDGPNSEPPPTPSPTPTPDHGANGTLASEPSPGAA